MNRKKKPGRLLLPTFLCVLNASRRQGVVSVVYETTTYSCHAMEILELTGYVTYCGSDAHEHRVCHHILCHHNYTFLS